MVKISELYTGKKDGTGPLVAEVRNALGDFLSIKLAYYLENLKDGVFNINTAEGRIKIVKDGDILVIGDKLFKGEISANEIIDTAKKIYTNHAEKFIRDCYRRGFGSIITPKGTYARFDTVGSKSKGRILINEQMVEYRNSDAFYDFLYSFTGNKNEFSATRRIQTLGDPLYNLLYRAISQANSRNNIFTDERFPDFYEVKPTVVGRRSYNDIIILDGKEYKREDLADLFYSLSQDDKVLVEDIPSDDLVQKMIKTLIGENITVTDSDIMSTQLEALSAADFEVRRSHNGEQDFEDLHGGDDW